MGRVPGTSLGQQDRRSVISKKRGGSDSFSALWTPAYVTQEHTMKNVGTSERIARTVAALPLGACALLAPFPLPVRLLLFGMPALVLLVTALRSSCLINTMLGRNTCSVGR